MGLRVLATLIVTLSGSILTFYNAFYGLLTYAFWSYANPEIATWGSIPMGRLSFVVGLAVVVSTFMQKKKLFILHPKNLQILAFLFICLISMLFMTDLALSKWQFHYFARVILVSLIITVLVDDLQKLRYYIWAMVIFIGLFAAFSGIKGVIGGVVYSGATAGYEGLIRGGRNYTAVFLCTIIPIVFYLSMAERSVWLKLFLWGILLGDIFALILTYSRGGFLGFIAVSFVMFAKLKNKAPAIIAIFLFVFLLTIGLIPQEYAYKVIPKEYVERLYSIRRYDPEEKDAEPSAAGRVLAWRSAIEMIKAHPIAGVGFYGSEKAMDDYPDPITGISVPGKAIHNTPLQVSAELGLPAFLLFCFIFFSIYRMLTKIKKFVRPYKLDEAIWDYASMFQVAFVGFFATGLFVNAAFLDISWHMAGLTIAMETIVRKEIAKMGSA